jgi:hypothetical protein
MLGFPLDQVLKREQHRVSKVDVPIVEILISEFVVAYY